MTKLLAVLGLSASLLAGFAAPVAAQFGSKNSCQSLAQSNIAAFKQLCSSERELPEFEPPTIGDDTAPETHCVGSLLPEHFPAGTRVLVAVPHCN